MSEQNPEFLADLLTHVLDGTLTHEDILTTHGEEIFAQLVTAAGGTRALSDALMEGQRVRETREAQRAGQAPPADQGFHHDS